MKLRELYRFLHPKSGSQSFYGSRARPGGARQDDNIQTVLQSICTTLCDVQSQLSTIRQQNDDHDVALQKLMKEVYTCNLSFSFRKCFFYFADGRS